LPSNPAPRTIDTNATDLSHGVIVPRRKG
jgi:hypothetical protein